MNVERMELLWELLQRGTIASVAEAMGRTPSAVSQQLKVLERESGTQLLEPFGRGVRLTEAGQILARGSLDVQEALERTETALEEFKHELRGKVRVSTFPTAGQMILPGAIVRLADAPGIIVECRDNDVLQSRAVGLLIDYHIVIAHSSATAHPWDYRDIVAIPLFDEPIDVALAPDHPLAQKASLTPNDVIDEPWIGVPEGYPFDSLLHQIELEAGKDATVVQRFSDNHVAEAFVAEGLGIAFVPRFTSLTDEQSRYVLRPIKGVSAKRHIAALVRRDHLQRSAVRRVLQAIREEAALVGADER